MWYFLWICYLIVKASICRACTFCHQIHAVKTEEVAKKLRQLNCCYLYWTLWMIWQIDLRTANCWLAKIKKNQEIWLKSRNSWLTVNRFASKSHNTTFIDSNIFFTNVNGYVSTLHNEFIKTSYTSSLRNFKRAVFMFELLTVLNMEYNL